MKVVDDFSSANDLKQESFQDQSIVSSNVNQSLKHVKTFRMKQGVDKQYENDHDWISAESLSLTNKDLKVE